MPKRKWPASRSKVVYSFGADSLTKTLRDCQEGFVRMPSFGRTRGRARPIFESDIALDALPGFCVAHSTSLERNHKFSAGCLSNL